MRRGFQAGLLGWALAWGAACDEGSPGGRALDGATDAVADDSGVEDAEGDSTWPLDGALDGPADGAPADAADMADMADGAAPDGAADGAALDGALSDVGDAAEDEDVPDADDADADAGLDASDAGDAGDAGDAAVDAIVVCGPDDTLECGAAEGACEPGLRGCFDGLWGPCEGAVGPAEETCDGQDEDCDGAVDEGLEEPCGAPCAEGLRRCVDGDWLPCDGGPVPDEACNGVDDDCDGEIDELGGRNCETGEPGRCLFGAQACEGGEWTVCAAVLTPRPEGCDGVDDDCDGAVDEGVAPRACGQDEGRCVAGSQRCVGGGWGPCDGAVEPGRETCDGVDEDCDGEIDEGLAGDRDEDGLSDCVEAEFGLDPGDPTDALGDFDLDGTTNADEIAAGTELWSTLYLHPLTEPGAREVEISLRLHQPEDALRPEIAEIFVWANAPRAQLLGVEIGPAALAADKQLAVNPVEDDLTRLVFVAANLNRMPDGELARLRYRRTNRRPLNFRVELGPTQFAPIEADRALDAGTAAHRTNLRVP